MSQLHRFKEKKRNSTQMLQIPNCFKTILSKTLRYGIHHVWKQNKNMKIELVNNVIHVSKIIPPEDRGV